MNWLKSIWSKPQPPQPPPAENEPVSLQQAMRRGVMRLNADGSTALNLPSYPIQMPVIPPRVVPRGVTTTLMAMDADEWSFLQASYGGIYSGFPGYPYLSQLATRAEYRQFAAAISTELTRQGIDITSTETAGDETKTRVKEITKRLKDLDLMGILRKGSVDDVLFGKGQFLFTIRGHDPRMPLIISNKTVAKGSFQGLKTVEPVWTTPNRYDTLNPANPYFYKPESYFVIGREYHSSRLRCITTRELPDLLKPAYNFGGISLSQLGEPYVNNWLRTRQSVADLLNNFSITALKTNMSAWLSDPHGQGADLFARAEFFSAMRSNKGLMLLDKDSEELDQLNVPLGSLDKLQAQSQEQMCSFSRIPAVIMTGLDPTGLNTSTEGTMAAWRDWIASEQTHYSPIVRTTLELVMLDMYGEVDPDISFRWRPLVQMTPKELSEIRKTNADAAAVYMDHNVIDPTEERYKLAVDPDSGYAGISLEMVQIKPPDPEGDEDETDNEITGAAGAGDDAK